MDAQTLKSKLSDFAHEFVKNSPENRLGDMLEPAWGLPFFGCTSAENNLFEFYKESIGSFYWTPAEIMQNTYKIPFDTKDLSIFCWVMPQTDATLSDQRKAKQLPSKRWMRSRYFGEEFNNLLRAEIVKFMASLNILAVAPVISQNWDYRTSEKFNHASNWSERHTAYACGLGTFSLSDGFITEAGKAVRIGSVVLKASLPQNEMIYKNRVANCLYYTKKICGACAARCPAGAISKEKGHDKQLCFEYIRRITAPATEKEIGHYSTPCGLCQAGVPCQSRNPNKEA